MFDTNLITENRLVSSKKKELTPVMVNSDEQIGTFVGSEGDLYTTTLDECSCVDFARNGYVQPCKHMIRLAMELGKLPDDGKISDLVTTSGRYYFSRLKLFIQQASLMEVIQFARNYLAVTDGTAKLEDDAFSASMDLASISESPLFTIKKNGAIKVEKAWKKDWDHVEVLLRNRLGMAFLYRIDNDNFISAFIQGE